jgi:signal transduction histidine kinase
MYQLILFNIFQNSVKYNQFKGEIIIVTDCLPVRQEEQKQDEEPKYILETEIIDTGIGIEEERQKMLFIPFLELKLKQNLKQVEDNNIGMGLACSEAISTALEGDITIKQSRRGLTVFAFKIPVTIKHREDQPSFAQEYSKITKDLGIQTF